MQIERPTLAELGRDLLKVSSWRLILSLSAPFAIFAAYFALAADGHLALAFACVVALSFITYGSISHDLVHRSLGLPRWLNDCLLTAIELLLLRSGRAYRLAHLNHHAHYPDPHGDPESLAAFGSFWAAIRSGPLFFLRLWWWAFRTHPQHRLRLVAEATAIAIFGPSALSAAAIGWTWIPLAYAILVYLGTWIVPLVTSYIPHAPDERDPLLQTRRFRGAIARIVAFDHLYHLYHFFPAVPHYRWAELARRLNPYLNGAGVPSIRLGVRGKGTP